MNESNLSPEEIQDRRIQQARLEAIELSKPFVDVILSIRRLESPSYIISGEGMTLISDGLSESDRKLITLCENMIKLIHELCLKSVTKS